MKCPICGKEMISESIYVSTYAHDEPNKSLELYVCYNCGNACLHDYKYREYKMIYREYKELVESKKTLEQELDSFVKANKNEFDKFEKLNKVRGAIRSLPEYKNDDEMLKGLLLKKRADKIEGSFNQEILAAYREIKHKITEVERKINALLYRSKHIIDFVEFHHLENY